MTATWPRTRKHRSISSTPNISMNLEKSKPSIVKVSKHVLFCKSMVKNLQTSTPDQAKSKKIEYEPAKPTQIGSDSNAMPAMATTPDAIGREVDSERVTDKEPLRLHNQIASSASRASCLLSAYYANQIACKSLDGSRMAPYSGQHDLCSRNATHSMQPTRRTGRDGTRVTLPLELPSIVNMPAGITSMRRKSQDPPQQDGGKHRRTLPLSTALPHSYRDNPSAAPTTGIINRPPSSAKGPMTIFAVLCRE